MEKITLLDTAVGSTNKGDEIIMQCVKEELGGILKNYFVLSVPTHLSSFNALECMGHLPDSASEVALSKYKFVCGTNLLSGSMLHRTNQWDINILNCKPIIGSVLVGVGGAARADWYTRRLYKKVLSNKFIHSVRDKNAYELVKSLGLQCVYTGCVTMWKLTPEFCKDIPKEKNEKVIFTITDYNCDPEKDKKMIETIKCNYKNIYFWIQGAHDLEYLSSITNTADIKIIHSDINEYSKELNAVCGGVDYIGTRLHAGIFAMRHKARAIIVRVDKRMDAMSSCIPNNTISRTEIDDLNKKINSSFETKCELNWKGIEKWKSQFN